MDVDDQNYQNQVAYLPMTFEEAVELRRTLLGRCDLDIPNMICEAASQKDMERVTTLSHMLELNKSLLYKLISLLPADIE